MRMTEYSTILDPIRARASSDPDWPGIVMIYEDGTRETITARMLWNDALAAATELRAAQLQAGDVAILIMGHSRQLIATFLGAVTLGVVPTIVSPATPRLDPEVYRRRIETLVQNAAAAAVITRPEDAAPLNGLACRVISTAAPTRIDTSITVAAPAPDSLAFIQYSSGSGGVQKGAAHSHAGLLRYLESKRVGVPFTPADVSVCWAPMYHDQGLLSGLLAPMVVGFRSVLMSPLHWVRQPGILLQAIHEYGGTVCYMPNFALNHCARGMREQDTRGLDLSRWRLLLLGGEPVRVDSMRAFVTRFAPFGFRESIMRAGYGMAEMVEGVTTGPPGPPNVDWINVAGLQRDARAEPMPAGAPGASAFVGCGPPKDGAELRIVGPDGVALPERGIGEIEVRCEYRMREYHRRPDLTRAAFREDGWFRSGDLGYLAAGELYVVGRKSDLIIVGGRKLAPEDIESVAEQVGGVQPGRSVAFGIADERSGTERVVLVYETVQPGDSEQQIALERELRRTLTQALEVTLGEVRAVERGWIIKTSSGKKARRDNREKYQREFGAKF